MPLYNNLAEIRKRLHHYLAPAVGACAGLTQQDLQQVIAGTLIPDRQTAALVGNSDGIVPRRPKKMSEVTGTELFRQVRFASRNAKLNLATFSAIWG